MARIHKFFSGFHSLFVYFSRFVVKLAFLAQQGIAQKKSHLEIAFFFISFLGYFKGTLIFVKGSFIVSALFIQISKAYPYILHIGNTVVSYFLCVFQCLFQVFRTFFVHSLIGIHIAKIIKAFHMAFTQRTVGFLSVVFYPFEQFLGLIKTACYRIEYSEILYGFQIAFAVIA